MSKYKRFIFCKRLYNNYLILIKNKDKIISFDEDLKIVELYGIETIKQEINHLILDGLDIKLYEFRDNSYNYFYKTIILLKIINVIIDSKK